MLSRFRPTVERFLYVAQESLDNCRSRGSKPGDNDPRKPLKMGGIETVVDLRAEWKQMYHETWRIERDFLYDPHTARAAFAKIEAKYKPYLDGPGLARRVHLSLHGDAGRDQHRPHVRRRAAHAEIPPRPACWAQTTRRTTAGTHSPRSVAVRTGLPAGFAAHAARRLREVRASICWR